MKTKLTELWTTLVEMIERYQVERMRKKYIHDRLEAMTDPTFLDRAVAGEQHA